MQSGSEHSIEAFKAAIQEGRTPRKSEQAIEPGFPLRVLIKPSGEEGMAEVRVEAVAVRSLWLWGQRHLLKGIAEHLHEPQ
jgi:hypothetical protein